MHVDYMSSEEFMELSLLLQSSHEIFYLLWNLGKPRFIKDEKLDTAAIVFNSEDGSVLEMIIDQKFWGDLKTIPERKFVIAHECSHVFLNHPKRMLKLDMEIANVAADLAVNHMLVNSFGMLRSEVDPNDRFIWIDKVFDPKENVSDNETFEFYYRKIMNSESAKAKVPSLSTVDDHSGFGDIDEDTYKDIVDHLEENLSDQQKEVIKDILKKHIENESTQAGTRGGNIWKMFSTAQVKKKRKWETVIKKWAAFSIKKEMKDKVSWVKDDRRLSFMNKNVFLPSEHEMEDLNKKKDKIDVFFFMDTSGSCHHLSKRFFDAAKSLPEDKFNVRAFSFATSVHPVKLESGRVGMGMGTYFHIIEAAIQRIISKEDIKYPKAVFVLTDGYGSTVNPQYPERWFWFLSSQYKTYIPNKSKCFKLSDYE